VSHEVDLPFLHEAVDIDRKRFAAAPPGYIPFRNALFYAAACYHAQAWDCCVAIGGHNAEEASLYPDAYLGFFRDLQGVFELGAWRGGDVVVPRLLMPLLALHKEDVHMLGARLGAPIESTWSCYEDGEGPCGTCPACARRSDIPSSARA
jgi:7-cyano-7-deazaguanine synthase